MLCAPLAGLVVGLLAAVPGGRCSCWAGPGRCSRRSPPPRVPAALTRGLHLDGLADTADGLGSAKPAEDALRIMKQSDIGPFGVITLLFVLLAQVAALFELYGRGWADGALGTVAAAVTARLALTLASRRGVPPARPEGLGAAVAGTVPPLGARGRGRCGPRVLRGGRRAGRRARTAPCSTPSPPWPASVPPS